MSVGVLSSTLSSVIKKQIATELHLEAKDKSYFVPKNDKKQFYSGEVTKSLNFFSIHNDPNNSNNDIIYLPYSYVCEKFKVTKPNDRLIKKKYDKFSMKQGFSLREYQKEAIRYAFEDFDKLGTAFFNVFCSYGKTVVTTFISYIFSQKMSISTLILVPQESIVSSWYETFTELTTASVYIVGSKQPYNNQNVIICPCHQVDKMTKDMVQNVGFLAIDEADSYCTVGHIHTLLATQPYRILALTATYERDDCMESMLDLIVGPSRIVKISAKPFFVLKISTPFTVTDVAKTSRGISYTDLMHKICSIPDRLNIILNLVLNNCDEKILILVLHVEFVELIYGALDHLFKEKKNGKTVSKYYGKMDGYYDADVLVGTYKKLGRGFDQKGKCKPKICPLTGDGYGKNGWDGRRFNMLILAASTLKVEQLAGRAFRSEIPCIVEIVDNHDNVRKHWAVRYKWFLSRNGIVMDIKTMFKWSELFLTPEYQSQYRIAKAREANDAVAPVRITKPSCIPSILHALDMKNKKSNKWNKDEQSNIDPNEELEFLNSLDGDDDGDDSKSDINQYNETEDGVA
jgi:hypothetical protein